MSAVKCSNRPTRDVKLTSNRATRDVNIVPNPFDRAIRLLNISDSHGFGLNIQIWETNPDINVMSICLGRQIDVIRHKVTQDIRRIKRFDPNRVILHAGHNDVFYHPTKNIH